MEPEIQEKIVTSLTDTELQNILDDLFMDDYVDLVEEMPANVVKRVMQNTTPANRKLINQYLKYPEDSAGSLMTNEYVYFRSGSESGGRAWIRRPSTPAMSPPPARSCWGW